jgi:hypothetical protein
MPAEVTEADRARWIADLADAPAALRAALAGLSADQIDTSYRPEGWTVRQVIHHVPDSHLHAYTRFKLALTEDEPTIKPYDEGRWSELSDVRLVDPRVSPICWSASPMGRALEVARSGRVSADVSPPRAGQNLDPGRGAGQVRVARASPQVTSRPAPPGRLARPAGAPDW